MPGKLDDASNLRFLHACLMSSDYSRIDFARVARQHGIQPPAARMRFARLNVALGGKSKTRKRAGSDAPAGARKKAPKEGLQCGKVGDAGEDEEDVGVGKVEEDEETRIKQEDVENWPAEQPMHAMPVGLPFASPQMDGRAVGYAYPQPFPQAYPQPPQAPPQMPYFQQQTPVGYPQGVAASPRSSFSFGRPSVAEDWGMDAK